MRTIEDLQSALDYEFAWRRKELSELQRETRERGASYLCRAAIALSYAHYEGFSKAALISYAQFITRRAILAKNAKPALNALGLKATIDQLASANNVAFFVNAVELFFESQDKRLSLKLHSFLDDVGNMKHELLIACMKCVGLGIDYFENLEQFVDKDLIKQRNEIAHGRHTTITASDAVDIIEKVIEIITRLKNDIIQGAETKKYLIGQ